MNKNVKGVAREMHTVVPDQVEAGCNIGEAHDVHEFKLNAEKFASRSPGEPSIRILRIQMFGNNRGVDSAGTCVEYVIALGINGME